MLLIFIVAIIFLLHIQFFLRNIFLGTYEVNFFNFTIRYLFDEDMAKMSLYFACFCAVGFAVAYLVARRIGLPRSHYTFDQRSRFAYGLPTWPVVSFGLLQVIAALSLSLQSGFVYQTMAEQLEKAGFIFELRIVFLLLISNLLLNVPLRVVMNSREFKAVRYVTYLYIFAMLVMQVRSRVFEVVAVIAFAHLIWQKDRVRVKYFFMLGAALIAPNIIVLGRLGWPESFSLLIDGVFSFEYTVLFNNLLSAAIEAGPSTEGSYTFSKSLGLLLPSPVRSVLDIEVNKSNYYLDLSEVANIRNGGFSLLAELYTNFGWHAIWVFSAVGAVIGYLNSRAMRAGKVGIINSTAPLFYIAFILAFRNDLGVFIKYSIQLFLIATVLHMVVLSCTNVPKLEK